jgi:ribosome biogenesis GTPase
MHLRKDREDETPGEEGLIKFKHASRRTFSAKKTFRDDNFHNKQRHGDARRQRQRLQSLNETDDRQPEHEDSSTLSMEGVVIERLGDRLLVKPLLPTNNNSISTMSKDYFLCIQKNMLARQHIVPGDRVAFRSLSLSPSTDGDPSLLHTDPSDKKLEAPSSSSSNTRPSEGVVHALSPRRNILQRPGFNANIHKKNLKNIAANIDQLCIVIAARPLVPLSTIDNYLAYAEIMEIPHCLIVINKADIQPDTEKLTQSLQHYHKSSLLNYKIVETSVETGQGLTELFAAMKNKTSIFVGQSGVGKSSLIDAILDKFSIHSNLNGTDSDGELPPKESIRIGDLVKNDLYGAHTTSNARLYELHERVVNEQEVAGPPIETNLIDSPGIRELSIAHLDQSVIIKGFKELYTYSKECKFRDCDHYIHHVHISPSTGTHVAGIHSGSVEDVECLLDSDPKIPERCKVIKAVLDGNIAVSRYFSYRYIMQHLLR